MTKQKKDPDWIKRLKDDPDSKKEHKDIPFDDAVKKMLETPPIPKPKKPKSNT